MFKIWYFLCRFILVFLPSDTFNHIVRTIHFSRLRVNYYPLRRGSRKTFSSFLWEYKGELDLDIYRVLADKVLVKEYLKDNPIAGLNIIPSYFIANEGEDLRSLDLSKDLIIKANHGSGWNYIVRRQDVFDENHLVRLANQWLTYNAYYLSREPQYRHIKPKLLVEELLEDNLTDYKFFCLNGIVKVIQVDEDRFINHRRSMYDRNWEELNISYKYEPVRIKLIPVEVLSKMVNIAEGLARNFYFVRVDLYEVNGKVYFGEFTFCPGGGNEPFIDFESDEKLLTLLQG